MNYKLLLDLRLNTKQPEEISNSCELFKYSTDPSGLPQESWELSEMENKQTRGAGVSVRISVHVRVVDIRVSARMSAVCTAGKSLILLWE